MPKRIIADDYVWKGVLYTAARNDETGKSVETEVEVPDDFPPKIGRVPGAPAPVTSTGAAGVAPGAPGSTAGPAPAADTSISYDSMDKGDLVSLVQARKLDVTGTGASGNVLKSDLITALEQADAEQAAKQAGNAAGEPPPSA